MRFAKGMVTFGLPQCCFLESIYLRLSKLKNRKGVRIKNWPAIGKFLSIFERTLNISFVPSRGHKAFYGYVVIDELNRLQENVDSSKCCKCGCDHFDVGHNILEAISGWAV